MTNPASPYLLDRLQARRAIPTTRSRRSNSVPRLTGLDDDLFLDEARSSGNDTLMTTPNNSHTHTNVTASLGAREMEKRMDKLSKFNFDLKLELFHCRERMSKLQENCKVLASRAEDANRLVEENATLLELNDSLVKELEHRDEAVQEAVSIICDLEERLERAQESQQNHHDPPEYLAPPRSSSLSPCSGPVLSPHKSDKSSSKRPPSASLPRRIPSFVGDKKPNTRALRSVYLEPTPKLHAVKSFASLASQKEDVDVSVSEIDTLDSPQLSVLSKSSFPSIYDLHRNQDGIECEANNSQLDTISRNAGSKHDSDSDINSWIQVQTPQLPVLCSRQGQMQQPRSDSDRNQYTSQATEPAHNKQKRTPSLKGSSFGGALLPPTPDSASTSVLQDSYMNGPSDLKVPPRMSTNLANAAKHAALLHTPEIPSIADISKLHTALDSKHYTNGAGWSTRHSLSLSSTDEEDEYYEQSDSNTNARTGSAGSDGSYPNGGSIVKGTPSRFQVRRKISPAKDMSYDGEGARQAPLQHRDTLNKEISRSQNENRSYRRMERSETTPNLAAMQTPPASLQRNNSTSRSSDMRPQRMERSETTPNLVTSMQVSHWSTPPSFQPGPPIKSQSSSGGGVRAALAQKTHKLLRRMSEHHTSSSDQSSKQGRLSPSKRPHTSTHGSSSGSDDSLAMQAANQAVTTRNLGIAPVVSVEAKSPSRGLFSRAAGSLRR